MNIFMPIVTDTVKKSPTAYTKLQFLFRKTQAVLLTCLILFLPTDRDKGPTLGPVYSPLCSLTPPYI